MNRLTRNQKAALRCYADAEQFHVPPENQGQIVLVSYGCTAHYIYERSLDRSDRTLTITAWQHPADADEYSFQPWNDVPTLGRRVGVIYRGPASGAPERDNYPSGY